jgi:steroid delta-isomerase
MTSADDIRAVYEAYLVAMAEHDLDGVMAMFAPEAVLHDPVDAPPRMGIEAIRQFFSEAVGSIHTCKLVSPVHISGDCRHGAASVSTEVALGDEIKVIDATDIMTFDDDGRVTSMTAYWGPTNFYDR